MKKIIFSLVLILGVFALLGSASKSLASSQNNGGNNGDDHNKCSNDDHHYEGDGQKKCATPTPTPRPTPKPTPKPTPTPTLEPCDDDQTPNDNDDEVCVTPTPTPSIQPESTPTPVPSNTPAPTSVPNPQAGSQSQMGIDGQICNNTNFDAWAIVKLDGNPASGVNVKFVYHNEAKFAKTEANGRAGVTYGYVDDEDVQVIPDSGYPSQSQHITKDQACKAIVSDPGKVLGATTMAKTGVLEETLTDVVGLMGAVMTAAGSFLYAKKRI